MRVSAAYTYEDGSCIDVTVDDGLDGEYHPVRMGELVGHLTRPHPERPRRRGSPARRTRTPSRVMTALRRAVDIDAALARKRVDYQRALERLAEDWTVAAQLHADIDELLDARIPTPRTG